jgi:hypothetical protein
MHKAIDLGKKYDDDIGIPISVNEIRNKVHYPDLHISDTDNTRLLDMPDSGEATIKFRVVSRNHSEDKRNGDKKRRCSLTLEVMAIVFEDKPKKKKDYGEDARKSFSDYFKEK